ncbi:MAG: carboxypeptidase regulatory-like domain-containing protein [Bacteroidales bacterium]|nr:carboxypeptidase regulatory-like domain-containing protein [Bacteroidales bacterium]
MIKKLLLTLGVILLLSSMAFSQTSTIKGVVKDQTGEPLAYTYVYLKTGDKNVNYAMADDKGEYQIFGVEVGTYDMLADAQMTCQKAQKIANVQVPSGQVVFIDFVIDCAGELDIVDITYEPPVFDGGSTSSATRITGENLRTTPGRSVTGALSALEGVTGVDGEMASVRGNRADGQKTIVDGVTIRGSSGVTMSSIEEAQLIQGGIPAEFGDGTSFTVITTKSAPRDFHGSVELRGSIDGYNNFLGAVSLSGPILKGKKKTDPARIGFLFSGEVSYDHDSRPLRGGYWVANDDVIDYLIQNPLRYSNTEYGVQYQEGCYLTSESFHKERVKKNAGTWDYLGQLKFDFMLGKSHNMKLSLGGSYEYAKGKSWSSTQALFNNGLNPTSSQSTMRVNARLNHRAFTDTSATAILKNIMYDINVNYTRINGLSYATEHKDRLFEYGYVGKFQTTKARSYSFTDKLQLMLPDSTEAVLYDAFEFNGWYDSVVTFNVNPNFNVNPILSQYTLNVVDKFPIEDIYRNYYEGFPYDLTFYQQFGALRNGDQPDAIYSMYQSPGTVYNGYSKSQTEQIGVKASISMALKNHELKFGFDFEKLTYRGYGIAPVTLWTLMRNEANYHISELDKSNPIIWDNGEYYYVDYNRYVSLSDQTFFDRNLREALGLNPDGDDWLDIDSYDPSTYSVDMFSAEELLLGTSSGEQPLVSYYGYDYTGKINHKKTTIDDFFNGIDEATGQKSYSIGAYEPVYMAFYLQDKFSIRNLLFNIGLRVDRFDANQSVLKDPYLFREAYTVGDLHNLNANVNFVGNAKDDWVVYYQGNDTYMSEADIQGDVFNSSSIVGYRSGDTWYDANGQEVTDPEADLSLYVNGPILKNEIDQINSITKVEASAFTDYKAQWSVMPRVSFSFNVNDNSLFYAHYNIITSRPTSLQISPIDYLFISKRNSSSDILTNPNMKPQQSIDYEIGFRQKVSNKSAISISAYYSEKRNQIQAYRFSGAYPNTYYSFQNIDFGTVQGFTFTYRMNRTHNLTLSANYTLQFAKGTGSSTTSQLSILAAGQPNLRTLTNLSFDQRHRIGVNLDYRFESGQAYEGPSKEKIIMGADGNPTTKEIQWLANTGFSLLLTAASGEPYTRSSTPYSTIVTGTASQLSGTINGSHKPWQFQADFRIDKTFMFTFNKNAKDADGNAKKAKPGYLTVYVDIQNLFNFKNVVSVYTYTGNPDDDGYLSATEYQQAINSQVSTESYIWYYQMRMKNPYNYSRPIRASLGLQFSF